MKIIIETSARHIHVTKEDLAILFGAGHALTPKKELSQPGQFVCEEKVLLRGPKNEIKGVSILGPERNATQVEISLTDARTLGVNAPIRESGDIEGTPGITVVGPCGEIQLDKGVIAAKRHIHFTPAQAKECGVTDKQTVSVKVANTDRSIIFGDVIVRVSPSYAAAMHIDTDEANAGALKGTIEGDILL